MNIYDYAAAIHLHSVFSFDGHVPPDKIIAAAARRGVDILLLTDHDNLKARAAGWEGWNGRVLLIVGQEISPRFNHYLAFAIKSPVTCPEDAEGIRPQRYINEVNAAGGFGIIAHPDHEGTKTFHVKHYPWQDWQVSGYAGISVWDFMTDWQSSLCGYVSGLCSYFFPAFFLRGPRAVTLQRWDALNAAGKKIVGIGELDNHASRKKLGGLSFEAFPFDKAFTFLRTHVITTEQLSGNKEKDIPLVLQSIRSGSCYVALDYFCNARGFNFTMRNSSGPALMGDNLLLDNKTLLEVKLPCVANCRVIKDGAVFAADRTKEMSVPIAAKGVYRIEAFLKAYGKYRPWIFSNPIFVR